VLAGLAAQDTASGARFGCGVTACFSQLMDRFRDRDHAGALLAAELQPIAGDWPSPVVLGIPRGGIVVADIVASVLDVELDVLGVEKIGAPWNPEFAVGAVGEDGALWLDEEMKSKLDPA